MKDAMNLNDWLLNAAKGSAEVQAIHFDKIADCKFQRLSGIELVRVAQAMLTSAVLFLRKFAQKHGVKYLVVFLPVDSSDAVSIWSPEIWGEVNSIEEPPTLYLLRGKQIFDDESEEYRRPICMPQGDQGNVRAIFRSFRNEDAIKNGWEFTSGVYLIVGAD